MRERELKWRGCWLQREFKELSQWKKHEAHNHKMYCIHWRLCRGCSPHREKCTLDLVWCLELCLFHIYSTYVTVLQSDYLKGRLHDEMWDTLTHNKDQGHFAPALIIHSHSRGHVAPAKWSLRGAGPTLQQQPLSTTNVAKMNRWRSCGSSLEAIKGKDWTSWMKQMPIRTCVVKYTIYFQSKHKQKEVQQQSEAFCSLRKNDNNHK